MTWIALVGPEEEENLSLRYIAASVEAAGFEAQILPFNTANDLHRILQAIFSAATPPLIVGISLAFQWRAKDCLALAVALREQGYRGHITAGGHFGTFAHKALMQDFPEFDSICRHEAERTMVLLAETLLAEGPLEEVSGVACRGMDGTVESTEPVDPPELESLPWPDRRGQPTTCLGHTMVPLVGSRGCYANCTFCCIAAWHRLTPSKTPFRTRAVDDVADEMAWLHHDLGVDIFVFHDDNFFVPNHKLTLKRIHALADALAERRVGRIATVVKARPTDVSRDVFQAARDRLGLVRTFLGIETDCDQGLETLNRRVQSRTNHDAMRILDELGIFVCFNMLIFDPDTTLNSLEQNLAFMETYAGTPLNFGRVELYAGTPLLTRMQQEGRCRGDYLGWDYSLATPEVQRVFELAMRCFYARNFAAGALANRLQATRFDVEVARHFHQNVFQEAWLDQAKDLSRRLTNDSVTRLRAIIEHVKTSEGGDTSAFVDRLRRELRQTDDKLSREAELLEETVRQAVGAVCRHARPSEAIVSGSTPVTPREAYA